MTVDTAAMAGQYVGTTVRQVIPVVRRRATPLVKGFLQRSDSALGGVVRENADMEVGLTIPVHYSVPGTHFWRVLNDDIR
jgi:hypothetical protein